MSRAEAGQLAAPPAVTATRSSARATLVNAATVFRLGLTPVVLALVLTGHDRWAALAFALAAVTDYGDGYLARRWGVATPVGSFLDTTADKILVTGALIAVLSVGRASPWAVLLIVGRELALMGLRGSAALEGRLVTASQLGRVKTATQFLAILATILDLDRRLGPLGIDQWALWLAVALTLWSAAGYVRALRASSSGPDERPPGP